MRQQRLLILSNRKVQVTEALTRLILVSVLTLAALLNADRHMEVENYVKFTIFILVLPHLFRSSQDAISPSSIKFVGILVYVQIALIFLGYFFSDVTASIAERIGFHISEKHGFILTREPFDPLKRSFSIFDNPNVAGRLLILTFFFYAINVPRLHWAMLVLVLIAAMATGSRAATLLFVVFNVWAAFFHREQRYFFRVTTLIMAAGAFLAITAAAITSRIFDLHTLYVSLAMKVEFWRLATNDSNAISVYDTDIALIVHQFGFLGLVVLTTLIASAFNMRHNIGFLAYAYCFSGSLIFSTPNIALMLLLKYLGQKK